MSRISPVAWLGYHHPAPPSLFLPPTACCRPHPHSPQPPQWLPDWLLWQLWPQQMASKKQQAQLEARRRRQVLQAKLYEEGNLSRQIGEMLTKIQQSEMRKAEQPAAGASAARGSTANAARPPAPPAVERPWPAPYPAATPGARQSRTAAAEASAAAAMAWASTATGHEAAAQAAEQRAATQPATHAASAAAEWACAAAAWRAAFEALEAAAQADPGAEAVRQADATLAAARGLSRQLRGVQGADAEQA